LDPKAICLKEFIRSSKFYKKKRKTKLIDYTVFEEFKNFVPVLIKHSKDVKEYILVEPSFEIE
jgi:hypothetical protein